MNFYNSHANSRHVKKNLSCCSPFLPLVPINPRRHSEWLPSPAELLLFLVQSVSEIICSFSCTRSLGVPALRVDTHPSHLTITAQESVEASEVTGYLLQSLSDHQSR